MLQGLLLSIFYILRKKNKKTQEILRNGAIHQLSSVSYCLSIRPSFCANYQVYFIHWMWLYISESKFDTLTEGQTSFDKRSRDKFGLLFIKPRPSLLDRYARYLHRALKKVRIQWSLFRYAQLLIMETITILISTKLNWTKLYCFVETRQLSPHKVIPCQQPVASSHIQRTLKGI